MIHANRVPAISGWGWITQGAALFRKEPVLWMAMAFVYLAIAVLLSQIPFVGWLVLVLFAPLCILGALPLAQALAGPGLPTDAVPAPPAGRELRLWVNYLRDLLMRAACRLFQGLADHDRLLPIMVVSTLLFGGVVAIVFLALLLKASPFALPAILSSGVGPNVWIMAVISVAVVLTLAALLLMAFLYSVPLILFRGEHPLPSIQMSFAGALNNLGAFAIFIGAFTAAGVALRVLFLLFIFPIDYLAFFIVGLAALPVFIAGLFTGYQDLFTSPP
jgi:hypothetical protein